ncbi:hypothetical protein A3A66_04170 [Microgenomates group bacterium RIFCSPLOWO2_01_FULL_46_13]|nr:MAG: hypothetical protein A2783_03640 [Microgenomates group bacterium RIFCSPHIGHO2_01_FULL_45_11]OGV94980.1 MAG: hypothetical protein A3A66_04170 [Microgenomates group bacterium RIFCSPLOWO2_01_FULL_46_13]
MREAPVFKQGSPYRVRELMKGRKMEQKVIKTGNSLAVTIPAKFVREVGLRVGDRVKAMIKPGKGVMEYTFLEMRQLPLSGKLLKRS